MIDIQMKRWLTALLTDKNGRVVVWQWPNFPLYAWMVFGVASHLLSGGLRSGSATLSRAALFIWAYLELTQGASYIRRILGLLVLGVLVFNSFR